MSIITISRGSFAGGQVLAECLAERLGYECVSREVIFDAARDYGISPEKLLVALEKPPSFWESLVGERRGYLEYVRAALCERARSGNLVYHGHAGHLLLAGISHVIRVRVNADMEFRILSAMERQNLGRQEAMVYIERKDKERVRWTRFLYGVEWTDPSLYDLVLNIEHMGIEGACESVIRLTQLPAFQPTRQSQQAMEDLWLSSRVAAALLRDRRTTSAEVTVEARSGEVMISGTALSEKIVRAVPEVARDVPGVRVVRAEVRQITGYQL